MSEYKDAVERHGSAVDAVAAGVGFEGWPVNEAMQLIAQMAREVAAAEVARRRH